MKLVINLLALASFFLVALKYLGVIQISMMLALLPALPFLAIVAINLVGVGGILIAYLFTR